MINSKDLLAKLLATEDLTVLHANAKTASFDVKSRVLTLPTWNEMNGDTYDHLTGHEVGHALYTPADGWGDTLKETDYGSGFKSFLNVVEDARIEKLIQRRYPGLRRSFVKSYKKMLADGFFGADLDTINTYPLIDRINTYFKAGASAGVRIDADEKVWIDEIEKLETWDGVVDVASRLYEYAKEKKEEEDALSEELNDFGDEFEDGDADGEYETGEYEETDDVGDDATDKVGVDGEGDDVDAEGEYTESSGDDVSSITDKALRNNIDSNYNDNSGVEVKNIMLNNADVSPLIVDYKQILSDFAEYDEEKRGEFNWNDMSYGMMDRGEKLFTEFLANNKKAIAYLTKEFEMKKSAKEYVRATTSKSGVVDPVKMNSYRYNDDIFKKVTVIPEGKSHGMIMYLDWSGSMYHDMKATIDQLLNLVNFCRNVNIPFRVYAFTDNFKKYKENGDYKDFPGLSSDVENDVIAYKYGFRYLELFSDKMRKKDFVSMSKYLLGYGAETRFSPYDYHLGGTPLDLSIMGAYKLNEMFLKQYRVDIVNTIFLTDGESHSVGVKTAMSSRNGDVWYDDVSLDSLIGWRFKGQLNIIDPVTKKRYPTNGNMKYQDVTELFLKIFREKTGSNVIGFRILPRTKGAINRELQYLPWETDFGKLATSMRKNKYCVIPSVGYTKYFGIAGGDQLETANGSFEVTGDETTAQLRNAFKKASKNKVSSRALLNEFVREVA